MNALVQTCTDCGQPVAPERRNYRYLESGLSTVILKGIEIANCPNCGNQDITIPRIGKVHRAIAEALASSPYRLTGEQVRFLRKYLGCHTEDFASYLHADAATISKWESGEETPGPEADRLIRLLAVALDKGLRPAISAIAGHLPHISDAPGTGKELHLNVDTLHGAFYTFSVAA